MSYAKYTVFNAQGSFVRSGSCPADMVEYQADTAVGETVVGEYYEPDTVISDGSGNPATVTAKVPANVLQSVASIPNDGVSVARFSNIPSGTSVSIVPMEANGAYGVMNVPVTDSYVDVDSTVAGVYEVSFYNASYTIATRQLEVTG
jgi:hypothetical protein